MDVSSASSQPVLNIYGEAMKTQTEQVKKLAMIALELKMEAEKFAMAEAAVMSFYA